MSPVSELTATERLLRACRREPVDRVPGWLMRQAGRYMPEYQAVRSGRSFLELCKSPDLCCDVTLQPLDVLGLEIGIVFSDILLPLEAMGLHVSFGDGGPVIKNPVRDREGVEALRDFDPRAATPWPADALRMLGDRLGPDTPIIGFCGAPFTLAAYAIEGGGSRQFENIKKMMFGDPDAFLLLLERLADNVGPYIEDQIDAGAPVVQVFDTWAGQLSVEDYEKFAHPFTSKVIRVAKEAGAPVISYVNGGGHVLEMMADSGADVVALDWRIDPADARKRIGKKVALQGNMDPGALLASPEVAARETVKNLEAFGRDPGYIFNVGSGILKWTPVPCAKAVADTLKTWR